MERGAPPGIAPRVASADFIPNIAGPGWEQRLLEMGAKAGIGLREKLSTKPIQEIPSRLR